MGCMHAYIQSTSENMTCSRIDILGCLWFYLCITAFQDKDFWTDGSNAINNDVYAFSDESLVPMDMNNFWDPAGTPSFGSTKCTRLAPSGGNWLWNDKKCGEKHYFICEYMYS